MKVLGVFAWSAITVLGIHTQDATTYTRMIERYARRNTIAHHDTSHSSNVNTQITTQDLTNLYPPQTISVPIDHFHNSTLYLPHTNDTFSLRYFFDASYYKPHGPVIVLQGGETSAVGRLPFLQKGILHDLIVATHGIGVVIEHRYYGESIPTKDFSNENLRFLTTEQALADQVYFAKNVVFPGLESVDLTSKTTPYLTYGGSYAGGFSAFLRKLYPDVYWGAIASSGVTQAIYRYWQYFEPIRVYGPKKCIERTQKITHAIDNVLDKNITKLTARLKEAWHLPNITYDNDLAAFIGIGIEQWQGRNWDAAVGSALFDHYCEYLSSADLKHQEAYSRIKLVQELLVEGGYGEEMGELWIPFLNWIAWNKKLYIDSCPADRSQDYCFSTHDHTFYIQNDISQSWRAWPWQFCTQWGYIQYSATPSPSILPIISKRQTLARNSEICELAFNITSPPNVTAINQWGGFNISYSRLAFIDGEQDPWRGATPHAGPFAYDGPVKKRKNSVDEPWYLIDGAVHHWDENGLSKEERKGGKRVYGPVKEVQREEVKFVLGWMREWRIQKGLEEKFEL